VVEIKGRLTPSSPTFYQDVMHRLGGETLTLCYQCGTCASSCPVARLTKRFNPRTILKDAILGNKEKVINEGAIWLCTSCFNCQERCPQEIEIAEIIYALRNMALKEKRVPQAFIEMASNLAESGRVVPIASFTLRRRQRSGLPPIKDADVDALNKILSATEFTENLAHAKEEDSE
jgi:heterodisulfide reductase subunit C